jgi:hypothetical protein
MSHQNDRAAVPPEAFDHEPNAGSAFDRRRFLEHAGRLALVVAAGASALRWQPTTAAPNNLFVLANDLWAWLKQPEKHFVHVVNLTVDVARPNGPKLVGTGSVSKITYFLGHKDKLLVATKGTLGVGTASSASPMMFNWTTTAHPAYLSSAAVGGKMTVDGLKVSGATLVGTGHGPDGSTATVRITFSKDKISNPY